MAEAQVFSSGNRRQRPPGESGRASLAQLQPLVRCIAKPL